MKSILLTAAVSALALGANAQISIIPEAGVNLASLRRTVNNQKLTSSTNARVRAGVNVGIGIGDHLSIQPGVFFSQKGGSNTDESAVTVGGITTNTNGKYEINTNYIEVPVNIVYYFNENQSGFFVNAGIYGAAAIGGKTKNSVKTTVGSVTTTTEEDRDLKIGGNEGNATTIGDDIRRWDLGFQGGVGYQTKMGLMIRAQYLAGAMNIISYNNSANSLRNGAVNIGIGYKIGR